MKPYAFHPEADEEFTDALRYHAEVTAAIGSRFYDEVERRLSEICAAPTRYRFVHAPVRRHLLKGFPYSLLYVERADHVLILAVAHAKRHPLYWLHRLG